MGDDNAVCPGEAGRLDDVPLVVYPVEPPLAAVLVVVHRDPGRVSQVGACHLAHMGPVHPCRLDLLIGWVHPEYEARGNTAMVRVNSTLVLG